MTRYQLTEYDNASAEVRDVYEDFQRVTGAFSVPNWLKSTGHSAHVARGYWEKAKGSLVCGQLPPILKELIVFTVSVANGAKYCAACHGNAVLQLDDSLSHNDLCEMVSDLDAVNRPAAQRAAIHFAHKMATRADAMTDADFESLTAAGYSQEQIAEIINAVDLAVMFNCYTKALNLELDAEFQPILPESTLA